MCYVTSMVVCRISDGKRLVTFCILSYNTLTFQSDVDVKVDTYLIRYPVVVIVIEPKL